MLTEKQVRGLRQWLCDLCNLSMGFTDGIRLSLRERGGRVVLDVIGEATVVRKCTKCGHENTLHLHPAGKPATKS